MLIVISPSMLINSLALKALITRLMLPARLILVNLIAKVNRNNRNTTYNHNNLSKLITLSCH
jgi:hypothetical protein